MKKTILMLLFAVVSLGASAQFEGGTIYTNTSLTGLGIGYDTGSKFNLGLDATGGYFVDDCVMLYGKVGYKHVGQPKGVPSTNALKLGAGARYYFSQNGIFMSGGLQYEYRGKDMHYVQLCPEVGYCFYLNHYVSVEPAIFADFCLNKFSEATNFGLKVGFGFYF